MLLIACSNDNDPVNDDDDEEIVIDEDFATNTKDTTFVDAVTIAYTDNIVTITNPYENEGVSITQSNGNVVVTSINTTTEINYVLSGTIKSGSFKIYSDYKFGLGLNGVSIISTDGPALNVQSGKKVTVMLVGGTSNRLVDSSTYTAYNDEDMKGAFFSEGQLNFQGNGNLLVIGRYKHAISSDDYIRIKGGNITISGAVSDGIHAKDYFRMDGGTLNIKASSDGIDCDEGYIKIYDGNITIKSDDDAIVASYEDTDTSIDSSIAISGGTINITTTGQKAAGIKSDIGSIGVTGGTINISTSGLAAKAFNAGGNMTIGGGELTLATTGSAYYDTDDKDISSAAGIKCDGDLTIDKGVINITASGAGGKGISVDGDLIINDGTINVSTTGDLFKYGSDDTAAKAIKSDGNVTVNGGTIIIKTTKEEAEGLESKKILTINNGTIEIEAYDDCINASNHIAINGGNIYCYSTSNDGIDSNGTMTITGGTIISSGTTAPEEGFDCDNNTFKITGGILVGTGGATSTPTSGVSTQRSVIYGTTGTSGDLIHIEASDGTGILTYKVPRIYNQMTLLFSSPDMKSDVTYTIYKGGSVSGGSNFHGLYSSATYSKGTTAITFTPSSMVTSIGTSTGGNGGRP
ncbi:carbohydrate-binding domain-containing protein [uncultured Dysgonomonas sp.]|uniref:carbohydrate-binding domain-containing protein n=1 Tax=uncultured Dysgonomonas sp. TaxID=206096 RepID=UPI0028051F79|nr:carbohydrate-binding domain-containing protein [uncultured Dysgonomonas sp.]